MIPSVFTFFNLFLGFLSIIKSIDGSLHFAAFLIILSALCDALDGKVARLTGMQSRFGFELDSLSDMVSFGIAPGVLAYVGILQSLDWVGILICSIFVFAGAYRLARFNSQNAHEEKHLYIGLTIPIAAITLASFWLFENNIGLNPGVPEWMVLIFALSLLMMSTLPYRWPRIIFDEGLWKKTLSIGILAAVLLIAVFPEKTMFPLLCMFILTHIVQWTASIARGESGWTEFFFLMKRND